MNLQNYDIIAIVGPTAVGKTKFSIELAGQINGEVINGDATQIYRDLNIGSAKVTVDEMQGIVHHLIDIKNPDEDYTVADFQIEAREKIAEIQSRGKVPIICGGSGLYIQSVLFDYNFNKQFDKSNSKYSEYDDQKILETYQELYPENTDNIDVQNPSRVRNYLIRKELGIEEEHDGSKPHYDNFKIIGITCERRILHERISDRVDAMIAQGLIEEVRQFDREFPSQSAIGYKEIHQYIDGEISLERAIELVKRNTRRFAKRQYTWFNNKMDVTWYDSVEDKWQ
ncbi:tRNA (adenosine(37)-N6)-dimethylallyltransferase MiaA [Mollicutes bacterium LVI A0039]|nr:tRNA (adenosine(37)-N6)-dimethylallyltransferase MiaA [Mollicutes bacterium LVI A0039]